MSNESLVSGRLLALLQCPIGRKPLRPQGTALVCPCGLEFAVRDGIPVMVVEEARLPEGCATLEAVQCPHTPAP
jgi:uncharacterized protein YbaR (Trm112 family)